MQVGGVPKALYSYDGRNRLSVRQTLNTIPAGTTHLIHDAWDRVLVETNGLGTAVREYIWLDDLPVAVLDGSINPTNPTLLWVHTDHLKRPELMTDASKAIVWKALYEPFGALHQVTGPAALEMRFPGQWFQLEAGLAYNWHRHYDATLGRYTQPDPLGTGVPGGAAPSPVGRFWALVIDTRAAILLAAVARPFEMSDIGQVSETGSGLLDMLRQRDAGIRVERDGTSLYGYAGQSPLMHTDLTGLAIDFSPQLIERPGEKSCQAPLIQLAAKKKSPIFRCVQCGAPHGGTRGPYCEPCYDKSLKPDSDVPPIRRIPGTKLPFEE